MDFTFKGAVHKLLPHAGHSPSLERFAFSMYNKHGRSCYLLATLRKPSCEKSNYESETFLPDLEHFSGTDLALVWADLGLPFPSAPEQHFLYGSCKGIR